MIGNAVAASATGLCAGAASWALWSRTLSLLLLPAQVVYAMRQAELEQQRKEFLDSNRLARRVTIPVSQPNNPTGLLRSTWGAISKRLGRANVNEEGNEVSEKGQGKMANVQLVCELDAVEILHPQVSSGDRVKYLVHMNANGVVYEDRLLRAHNLQKALSARGWLCNMLVFNFRGVGHSTGRTLGAQSLVDDARAAIEYLLNKGVLEQDILVHGHSIGGAAAVVACAQLKRSGKTHTPFVFADRTFDSLLEVVRDKLGGGFNMGPVGAAIFANLAMATLLVARLGFGITTPDTFGLVQATTLVLTAGMVWTSETLTGPVWPFTSAIDRMRTKRLQAAATLATRGLKACAICGIMYSLAVSIGPAFSYAMLMSIGGYILGAQLLLNRLALSLVQFFGWDIDVGSAFKSLDSKSKLVAYHNNDEMIPMTASLSRACDVTKDKSVALHGAQFQLSPHMNEVFSGSNGYRSLDMLRPFFDA